MGDKNSNVIIYPFRVMRPDDIPIIIPSQSGYDNSTLKDSLRYYRYAFFSPENSKYAFGRSAEDLAGKIGAFLKKFNFDLGRDVMCVLSPLEKKFNLMERDREFTYECFKFNGEERFWFNEGLDNLKKTNTEFSGNFFVYEDTDE